MNYNGKASDENALIIGERERIAEIKATAESQWDRIFILCLTRTFDFCDAHERAWLRDVLDEAWQWGKTHATRREEELMYTAIWIEGEKNLESFCQRRFGENPRFVETIGHVGQARIEEIYKYREDKDRYVPMYLLSMPWERGEYSAFQVMDKRHESYEQIRADRTSILMR